MKTLEQLGITREEYRAIGRAYLAGVQRTAIHEAGHAVAGLHLLGARVTLLSCEMDRAKARLTNAPDKAEAGPYLVYLLAGRAAERRYNAVVKAPDGKGMQTEAMRQEGATGDLEKARRAIREAHPGEDVGRRLASYTQQAEAYVKARWDLIYALGHELFIRTFGERPVRGDELQDLIAPIERALNQSAVFKKP